MPRMSMFLIRYKPVLMSQTRDPTADTASEGDTGRVTEPLEEEANHELNSTRGQSAFSLIISLFS